MTVSTEVKRTISEEADKIINHELVSEVVKEFAHSLGLNGLPVDPFIAIGLYKLALYSAVTAIAVERGIDPNDLRMTQEEAAMNINELMGKNEKISKNN